MWGKYGQNQMGNQAGGNQGVGGNMLPMGGVGGGFGGQGMMQGQPGMQQQMQYNPMQQQQQMQMQQMNMGAVGGIQSVPGQMTMVPPSAVMPMNVNPTLNPNVAGVSNVGGNIIQQQILPQQQQMSSNVMPTQLQQQQLQTTAPMLNTGTGMGMPMVGMPLAQQVQSPAHQQQSPAHQPVQHQMNPSVQQLQHQQQQQQQIITGAQQNPNPGANSIISIPQPNTHKEINIVQLSRLGQETVQDIASRFQEVFSALKNIQPSPHRDNSTEKKVQEYFRTIRLLFKRVRIIYEKCNDAGMEYTHVESLIPYKDEPDPRTEAAQCEEYRKALQENQDLIETVKLKNRQLREIIDRTRIIIWEINTMLSMRRS